MIEQIRLHLNENPFGLPKKVERLLVNNIHLTSQYADVEHSELVNMLADKHHIETNQIALGCGASRLFLRLARAFLTPDSEILAQEYVYHLYRLGACENSAKYVDIPARNFQFNIDDVIAGVNNKTSMIVLTNPSNPLGTFFTLKDIRRLLDSVPSHITVIVDQAYIAYASFLDENCQCAIPLVDEYKNLVVLNSFSKLHGLAGLRMGYAVGNPEIIEKLKRYHVRFALNSLAEKAACIALDDEEFIKRSLELNKQGREYLESEFSSIGLDCIPTLANFITVDLKQNAKDIVKALAEKNILVTSLDAHNLPNFLRVSTGKMEDLESFVKEFKPLIQRTSS